MASTACDLVRKYDILKTQNILEEKAKKEWRDKWGFYLEFDRVTLEEAAKRGMSEAKYKKITVKRKPKGTAEPAIWKVEPTKHVPKTTSGNFGQ